MATLVLTNEFKLILESEEIKNGLTRKGYATTNEFIAAMIKRINQFDPLLKLKDVAFHDLQNADKYIGVILDETLNKQYNFCVIPPKLGTRSGFLTQQIFGFISNIILKNKSAGTYSLCDKPVIVINCMLDENIAPSATCNIIGAKLVGFNYIDMFNRKVDFGTQIHTLKEFNEIVGQYKDISKDFVISNDSITFKTERLKGLKENLTNEPYYFAINSYPALFLAHREGYTIDISEFDEWYNTSKNNKNIEAFVTIAKKLQSIQPNKKTSTIYKNYLLAICTKPFLLLAGISGTGKSRIVRELAFKSCPEYLQDKDGTMPGNYCMIEVKPNWHDSTELLGYYSNLNMSYQFKKFVKFLVKAKMNPEVPFFVCLDEMNLAPVEQYFAEILSIMETRKHPKIEGSDEINKDIIKTGAIIDSAYFEKYTWKGKGGEKMERNEPMSDRDWYFEFFNQDTLSEGEKAQADKYKGSYTLGKEGLTLPDNVIIIGTVNMDDTTHQFSRKVIDRAMTIEMNGGKLSNMFGGSKDLEYLPQEEQEKWQNSFRQLYVIADEVLEAHPDEAEDIVKKVPEKLENINKALKGTPFEVSYRVLNELTIMVGVLLDSKKEGENIDDIINQALDHILLMKILPRIEGDSDMFNLSKDFKQKNNVEYNNRLEWLMNLAPEIKAEEKDNDDHRQTAREKIKEMIERLENQEFTRFWP